MLQEEGIACAKAPGWGEPGEQEGWETASCEGWRRKDERELSAG